MPTQPADNKPIQINEDLEFQVRMTYFQRIGRWMFFLLVVGALAGLSGGGPLSRTTAHDAAGRLRLRFDRFARASAEQSLELEISSEQPESEFEVWIDAAFLRRVQIESIFPQPDEQSSSADGVRLDIDVKPPSGRALILVRYRPLTAGWLPGRVRVGRSQVSFDQLVYP